MPDDNEIPLSEGEVVVESCTFEGCDEKIIGFCQQCSLRYCLEHASEVDPQRYCINCLLPEDAAFTESPLIDKDGVTHKGRVIHPVGKAYRLATKMICEMTDEELLSYVKQEQQTVREIENIREYHRANLGIAEAETYHRELSGLSKVGGVLRWGTSTQGVPAIRHRKEKTTKPVKAGSKVDDVLGNLQALGLKPEDLLNLLNQVKTTKKK